MDGRLASFAGEKAMGRQWLDDRWDGGLEGVLEGQRNDEFGFLGILYPLCFGHAVFPQVFVIVGTAAGITYPRSGVVVALCMQIFGRRAAESDSD